MSYRNIKDIVSQSFEQSRDLRIEHTIEQSGASHLLSAVYNADDAEKRKFYRKPKLAEGEETKLAILYGETMITPYILDVGVGNGINDPANITRTIRFIAGDGETEGVVIGPNGSLLENVYMGSEGEQAQPVIDDDGKPSTKDILIGAALGGIVQSIPSIWDAITNDAPDADKVGEIDPTSGEKIKTIREKAQADKLTSTLNIEGLANVTDESVVKAADDYILVYDGCTKTWVPKHISEIMANAITTSAGTPGEDGTVGTPGTTGSPARPATPEITTDPVPVILPDESLQKDPCDATQRNTVAPFVEMVDISDLEANEYFETRDCFVTSGIQLHFLMEGIGIWETWDDANAVDSTSEMPCLTGEVTNNPNTVTELVPGTVIVNICISTEICGSEYAFYEGTFSTNGLSETDFTRHTEILWADTLIQDLINRFPGQISSNFNIRLRRMDGLTFGGCPQSIFPAHYQGAKLLRSELFDTVKVGAPGDLYPTLGNTPNMDDDGAYPDLVPLNNSLGADTCPARTGTVYPAQPAVDAVDAVPPVAGTPATAGTPGETVPADKPVAPTLEIGKPFSTQYCPDYDANNAPNLFDKAGLATIVEVTGGTAAVNVTVSWIMAKGKGLFVIEPGMPVSISAALATDAQSLTLIGPPADMPAASLLIKMQAADDSVGEIHYKITLENDEGTCAGMLLKVVPCSNEIGASVGACAEIEITGDLADAGTTQIFATMPSAISSKDFETKSLNAFPIAKIATQTLDDYVQVIATNIQNNITNKNALALTDPEWLPAFTITVIGPVIKVCAPTAAGDAFNGMTLSAEQTGDVGVDWLGSILDFFGGSNRTISNTPSNDPGSVWSTVGDVLLNIGGNIAGMAVANMLFNDSSTLSISMPEEDKDVTVAFLYRGRKVKMPSTYDQATRSGTPTYSGWAGDWTTDTLTKVEWSDNPAYCLLDYIENRKFGLGDDIVLSTEQKNQLVSDIFEIAAYCDEVVDGEARFSLNTAITDGTKIQILEQLCSVFFGSFVFYKGGLRIRADKQDSVIKLLVNQANSGDFTYEHATLKSFINKVVVTYVDPNSFYIEKTVTVENQNGITKYGEKSAAVFGFGITSETQALRYANWVLQSEIENSLTVSYKGGWDHYNLVPGDIVQFEDSNERGSRLAGRCTVSGTSVAFDSDCIVVAGDAFSVIEDDGVVHETTIATVTNASNVVLNAAPSGTVVNNSTFIIGDQTIGKQLFRVVKVDETSDGVFNTTLQLYNDDKYNLITAVNRS